MPKNTYNSLDSYESTRQAAIEKIKKAAESTDNDLLEEVAEEVDPKKVREREKNCQALRMVFEKCMESYRDGEYSFKKSVDMLCEAMKELC